MGRVTPLQQAAATNTTSTQQQGPYLTHLQSGVVFGKSSFLKMSLSWSTVLTGIKEKILRLSQEILLLLLWTDTPNRSNNQHTVLKMTFPK